MRERVKFPSRIKGGLNGSDLKTAEDGRKALGQE